MKSIRWNSLLRSFTVLVIVSGVALAQAQTRFAGLINDYSPSTVKGGPWEMHGSWFLRLQPRTGTATFSTEMTMSGYAKTDNGGVDATQPGQSPHVHHILLANQAVQWLPDESAITAAGCPTFAAPTDNNFGFKITGPLSLLTGNGQPAPFDNTVPPQSTLTVCVTGVKGKAGAVKYSNVTLTFGSPASSHFGSQPVHGVVTGLD